MKAMEIIQSLILIPLLTSFILYWYNLDDYFPNTNEMIDNLITTLKTEITKVTSPDYGLMDILGGLLGTAMSIFSIIFNIPFLIATFLYESANLMGLTFLAPILYSVAWIMVMITYIYYALVILAWINPSWAMQN